MTTILVAVDFSPCGQHALQAATRLARDLGAAIRIVHAFEPNPRAPVMAGLGYRELFEELAAELETEEAMQLSTWAQEARASGIDVETEARPGREADVILGAAEAEDVFMLVLGTHGRSGFKKLLLGSVAQEVLRRSSKPVLVVPQPPAQ